MSLQVLGPFIAGVYEGLGNLRVFFYITLLSKNDLHFIGLRA